MGKSIMEELLLLPEEEQKRLLAGFDEKTLNWDWSVWGRPEQLAPVGNWNIWIYLAGRGAGKTRAAAEWVREQAKYTTTGQRRFALVARTAADVRDVIVEGESGIMNVTPPSERPIYEPSKRRLTWPNGNTATCFTADEPDSLRGPQFTHAWGDEVAAWRQTPDAAGMTAFDNLRVGTRLGANPQIMVTTTPKRVPLLYQLLKEADTTGKVVVTRGSTLDNRGNLSQTYLDTIVGVYQGTRLAQQELYGEMLSDVEGALWTIEMIEASRQGILPPSTPLRIIGVDPSVAENPRDECGIVVCAATADRDLYGGALVRNAINAIDPNVKVLEVHSKHGKQLRAEPTVLAYEQGRVHHLGYLADLETQMTQWIPGEGKSPDRVDALVHALTALMIKPPEGFFGGRITAKSPSARRLPPFRSGGGGARIFNPR